MRIPAHARRRAPPPCHLVSTVSSSCPRGFAYHVCVLYDHSAPLAVSAAWHGLWMCSKRRHKAGSHALGTAACIGSDSAARADASARLLCVRDQVYRRMVLRAPVSVFALPFLQGWADQVREGFGELGTGARQVRFMGSVRVGFMGRVRPARRRRRVPCTAASAKACFTVFHLPTCTQQFMPRRAHKLTADSSRSSAGSLLNSGYPFIRSLLCLPPTRPSANCSSRNVIP
jgi:hypothetical protein